MRVLVVLSIFFAVAASDSTCGCTDPLARGFQNIAPRKKGEKYPLSHNN